MILAEKLKEAASSVVPVMLIVWLMHVSVAPIGDNFEKFVVGGILLILGLGIFLLGAETGIVPIGQRAGSALTEKRSLPLLLTAGFITGFFITVAEPDVHVLAQQVASVAPSIKTSILVAIIAIGVGLFVAMALLRVVMQISLRLMLAVFYCIIFACAAFTSPAFLGVAFDAGGATTGPMTVPFILALGIGVAAVRSGDGGNDSFGLIGIASIGPVLAVLIMGMFSSGGGAPPEASTAPVARTLWAHFLSYTPEVAREVGLALSPLVVLFLLFRLFLLKRMSRFRVIRTIAGLVYTYIGLVLFFVGVKGGFIPAGSSLGAMLAAHEYVWLLFLAAFVLGALAVFAEPAVWVLASQVEDVSGGAINSRVILAFLCIGVASAVALALFRLSAGLSLWYFLIPGYLLAFLLTLYCPPMFTAIAFDSGGVASGPMASTFILAFTLGASRQLGGDPLLDAFGAIALIAMTPLVAIQILGVLYARKMPKKEE